MGGPDPGEHHEVERHYLHPRAGGCHGGLGVQPRTVLDHPSGQVEGALGGPLAGRAVVGLHGQVSQRLGQLPDAGRQSRPLLGSGGHGRAGQHHAAPGEQVELVGALPLAYHRDLP